MNRFDTEFWNGALKGIMLAEKEIEKIMEKDEGAYLQGKPEFSLQVLSCNY